MKKVDLNGQWILRQSNSQTTHRATVPGCNYLDLIKAEVLPDPFLGTNEKTSLWVAEKDWEYTRYFEVNESLINNDRVYLQCEMIDTIAEVLVNDKLVHKNMSAHIGIDVDVKDYLIIGQNKITVRIFSPVKYINDLNEIDKMPRNGNGLNGQSHIRKPQSHFGWDWGPTLPPSGITKDIYLMPYNKARLLDLQCIQEHKDNVVLLDINQNLEKFDNENIDVIVKLIHPSGAIDVVIAENGRAQFEIENPELWWTAELSGKAEQPLYIIQVELKSNTITLETKSTNVGLRTIKLNRDADQYGNNFCFEINGIPIFCKGANWIPSDSFVTRTSYEKLEFYIRSILSANMNIIRVWGGGYYESQDFYDLCDKLGLLVWQDFAFACTPYPFYDDEFLKLVNSEVDFQVKRLRSHPSLALWCGNNEIEAMSGGWMNRKKLLEWTDKYFYGILPAQLAILDNSTPFINGSPTGSGYNKDISSEDIGDTHLWSVWHGLQPLNSYRGKMTRFCSEFGIESLPSMDAIRTFSTPEDYSLKSEVFMAHQKCTSGNKKMLFYMATKFFIPYDFADLVYYTGLIQQEGIKDATEHWRRNRGRCNGSMYWQLNDCWQVSSWSSIDYLGKFKPLQYAAKHFNAPLTLSIMDAQDVVKVFLINDFKDEQQVTATFKICSYQGKEAYSVTKELKANKLSSTEVFSFDLKSNIPAKERCQYYALAELKQGDKIIARRTTLLTAEKNAKLSHADITYKAKMNGNKLMLNIKSDVFARSVGVDIAGVSQPFDDNYFDLLPNESKQIEVKVPDNFDLKNLKDSLKIRTVANISCNKSKLKNWLQRIMVVFIPLNIINVIVYKFFM